MKNEYVNVAEEMVVLGRVLQSPDTTIPQVGDVLRPEHFSVPIHQKIYAAVRDAVLDGRLPTLGVIEARVGDEYDGGKSTMVLMTSLVRGAEEGWDLDGVEVLVDLWKRRTLLAELQRALKEVEKGAAFADNVIADHKTRLEDIGAVGQVTPVRNLGYFVDKALHHSTSAREKGVVPGDDTGLPELDEIVGRLHPGDLGFIGADPGAGKTILAQQIAYHIAARRGRSVLFFQMEMQGEDMAYRHLAGSAGMSTAEVEEGRYNFDQFDLLTRAGEEAANIPFWLDDRPDLTIDQVEDRIRSVKRERGLSVVIVDHLLKVEATGQFKDYFAKTKFITNRSKIIAKRHGVCLIYLVHRTLGAQRSSPIPKISDFDGGSSIQRDADWVLGAVRPDIYWEYEEPHDRESAQHRKWSEHMRAIRNTIDIYLLKGRRAPRGTKRSFGFDGKRSYIGELSKRD